MLLGLRAKGFAPFSRCSVQRGTEPNAFKAERKSRRPGAES